jgi:HTH-type transcriptional regulator/antitoxin HigA
MATPKKPARVVSPGRILSRELEARGWTQRDLATILGRPYQAINEIINGKKQITPDTARELAKAFDTSMDFWINLEANYRLFLAREEEKEKEIELRSRIFTIAPVSELIKRGWISEFEDTGGLSNQICSFLGIQSPFDAPSVAVSLRHSAAHSPEEYAKIAWVKRVEQLARCQPIADFAADRLEKNISNITALSQAPELVADLPKLLRDLGVHFLIVPHLPSTYIDGAALLVEGHPVVATTLRYDRLDYFWFTVLHELAHILLGHPAQLDSLFDQSQEKDTKEEHDSINHEESRANDLALRWLLDPEELSDFIDQVAPYFSKAKVQAFADQHGRHPGIILGQLQHRGAVSYNYLRAMLVKVKPYLEDWIDVPVPRKQVSQLNSSF